MASTSTQAVWTARVSQVLDELVRSGQQVTYLELADRLEMPGPRRIQRLTQCLEESMAQDAAQSLPPRAALVVSRDGSGRPRAGFFECAQKLGLLGQQSPDTYYEEVLAELKHLNEEP